MLVKGIGIFIVLLMIVAIKSSYQGRILAFVGIVGLLLFLGLNKGRR